MLKEYRSSLLPVIHIVASHRDTTLSSKTLWLVCFRSQWHESLKREVKLARKRSSVSSRASEQLNSNSLPFVLYLNDLLKKYNILVLFSCNRLIIFIQLKIYNLKIIILSWPDFDHYLLPSVNPLFLLAACVILSYRKTVETLRWCYFNGTFIIKAGNCVSSATQTDQYWASRSTKVPSSRE